MVSPSPSHHHCDIQGVAVASPGVAIGGRGNGTSEDGRQLPQAMEIFAPVPQVGRISLSREWMDMDGK